MTSSKMSRNCAIGTVTVLIAYCYGMTWVRVVGVLHTQPWFLVNRGSDAQVRGNEEKKVNWCHGAL